MIYFEVFFGIWFLPLNYKSESAFNYYKFVIVFFSPEKEKIKSTIRTTLKEVQRLQYTSFVLRKQIRNFKYKKMIYQAINKKL